MKLLPSLTLAGAVALAGGLALPATGGKLSEEEAEKLKVLMGYSETEARRQGYAVKKAPLTKAVCEKFRIREAVMLLDPDYDRSWVYHEERVRAFFSERGMPILTVPDATKWMKDKLANGADGTSIIMAMGITPDTWLAGVPSETLVARYLKAGGRICWAGDIPFLYLQGEYSGIGAEPGFGTDNAKSFRLGGFIGMEVERAYMLGGYTNGIHATETAHRWGLERLNGLVRPVVNTGVLDAFTVSDDGRLADGGQVCFSPRNPLSGFVMLSGAIDGNDVAMMRDLWRIAWWSGSPVVFPDGVTSAFASNNRDMKIVMGNGDRTVFLRSECVPLRIDRAIPGNVVLRLEDDQGQTIRKWNGHVVADGILAPLDLSRLRRGIYTVVCVTNEKELRSELRIGAPVDKDGLRVAMWTGFSTSAKRVRHQFEHDLLPLGVEPMPTDDGVYARDISLWYGVPFTARRMHGQLDSAAPEGYDNWMRLPDGSIRPVLAEGNRPISKSYDNPQRRADAAACIGRLGEVDARYPAYCGVTATADDYSQWFGPSWNRFAKEGFRKRYGIDLPTQASVAPEGVTFTGVAKGFVRDDDPAILASRWFADTFADMGGRMSQALRDVTGGRGRLFPIPGGMQLPMNMWSAMNPELAFGPGGWSLGGFYYYNTYWQPFTANAFWTAVARMGDRTRDIWVMPDCMASGNASYYDQNIFNLLAAGVRGLAFYRFEEKLAASDKPLKRLGVIAKRYGRYLNGLKPVPAKAVMAIPFENMISNPCNWHGSVIPWSNLVLSGLDVDPVSMTEDWTGARAVFVLNVETLTEKSRNRLMAFMARGGLVYQCESSARSVPLPGAKRLPDIFGRGDGEAYGAYTCAEAERLIPSAEVRPFQTSDGSVYARRYADALGNRVCWFVDTVKGPTWRKFNVQTRGSAARPSHPDLEEEAEYGKTFTTSVTVNEIVPLIVWDVFARRALPFDGKRFDLTMGRLQGRLIAFLPESPRSFSVEIPKVVRSGEQFNVSVTTSGKCAVPFTVKVMDPRGAVSEEYRGRLVSGREGRTSLPFAFAENDLVGDWIVSVRNEFTGEDKTAVLSLANR